MLPGLEDQSAFLRQPARSTVSSPFPAATVIVLPPIQRYLQDATSKRVIGVAGDVHSHSSTASCTSTASRLRGLRPAAIADWRSVPANDRAAGSFFMMGDHRNSHGQPREIRPQWRQTVCRRQGVFALLAF